MTDDEEENAVRQLCDLIGHTNVAKIAMRLSGHDDRLHDALQQMVDWVKDGCPDDGREIVMTESKAALKGLSLVT